MPPNVKGVAEAETREAYQSFLMRCCTYEKKDRFKDAGAFADALLQLVKVIRKFAKSPECAPTW